MKSSDGDLEAIATDVAEVAISDLLTSEIPCAVVDNDFRIIEASPGLARFLHGSESLADAFSLRAQLLPPLPGTVTHGMYADPLGEFVPVAIQFLPLKNRSTCYLAIICDGRAFRDADFSRLSTAPYPALRMNTRGVITAATKDMANLFSAEEPSSMIGGRFIELFAPTEWPQIDASLSNCLQGRPVEPIAVFPANDRHNDRLELALLPDSGPDNRVLGVIALLRSLKIDDCRERLKRISMEAKPWRDRIGSLADELKNFISFDFVTFGIYATDVTAFRAPYVYPQSIAWPAIWIPISPGVSSWLCDGRTWESDLPRFIEEHPEIANDPVTRLYVQMGARSFITVPVMGDAGPICSITFSSKVPNHYDQKSLAILKQLTLDQVLTPIHHELIDEIEAISVEIDDAVCEADNLKDAANSVVSKLHSYFHWDHVSILNVDSRRGVFKLLAQEFDEGCDIPRNFEQAIDVGMLGRTLVANKAFTEDDRKCLILDDRRSGRKFDYRPTNAFMKSALTCPIRFNGEWRWILNVEAVELNAFHDADSRAVIDIVYALEASLGRLYQAELNRVILSSTREGVIVVDHAGTILTANKTASERLLGTDTNFGNIIEYAGDPTSARILAGELADASRRLVLKSRSGTLRTVLGIRSDIAEELQGAVWFLTDLDTLDWNVDFRYLRTIANDVAQQTRPSLLLASSTMQRAVKSLRGTDAGLHLQDVAQRVVGYIAKADITFERLAELQSVTKSPLRNEKVFSVNELLRDVVSSLPDIDRKNADAQSEIEPYLLGDRGSMGFVFRSLIDYLLRCGVDDDPDTPIVRIILRPLDKNNFQIIFALSDFLVARPRQERPSDPLWQAVDAAHADAGLGLFALGAIIEAHRGAIEKFEGEQDPTIPGTIWAKFVVTLPFSATDK